jgi:hypothetical protein
MSKINVDTWEPESGTALTMGATGDTTTVPSGASLVVASGATINITGATQTGFPSAGFTDKKYYTASATWTKPTDITKLVVEVQGAGGSGSMYNDTQWVGGGTAGGYVQAVIDVTNIDTATIVVGSGGAAQGSNAAGADGGLSSFAKATGSGSFTTLSGTGGNGNDAPSSASTAEPGVSGTGPTDALIIASAGGPTQMGSNFQGGDSMFGFGGNATASTTVQLPNATGYGAGGGGGYNISSGSGAPGLVIVTEYK